MTLTGAQRAFFSWSTHEGPNEASSKGASRLGGQTLGYNFSGFDAMAVKLWGNVHLSFSNKNMKFHILMMLALN